MIADLRQGAAWGDVDLSGRWLAEVRRRIPLLSGLERAACEAKWAGIARSAMGEALGVDNDVAWRAFVRGMRDVVDGRALGQLPMFDGVGNLYRPRPPKMGEWWRARLPEEFRRRWRKDRDGCWIWTGFRSRGRGWIQVGRSDSLVRDMYAPAYRVAYEMRHGTTPLGVAIIHTCGKSECVNPDHMTLADPGRPSRSSRARAEPRKVAQ